MWSIIVMVLLNRLHPIKNSKILIKTLTKKKNLNSQSKISQVGSEFIVLWQNKPQYLLQKFIKIRRSPFLVLCGARKRSVAHDKLIRQNVRHERLAPKKNVWHERLATKKKKEKEKGKKLGKCKRDVSSIWHIYIYIIVDKHQLHTCRTNNKAKTKKLRNDDVITIWQSYDKH